MFKLPPSTLPDSFATHEICPDVTMRMKFSTNDDKFKIIQQSNENKSQGFGGYRASDIKNIIKTITPIITYLNNRCNATSSYPDKLKILIIRPSHARLLRGTSETKLTNIYIKTR